MGFSPQIKIQDLQNNQNSSFVPSKNCQLLFHINKIWVSQIENCKIACPGLYFFQNTVSVLPTNFIFISVMSKISMTFLKSLFTMRTKITNTNFWAKLPSRYCESKTMTRDGTCWKTKNWGFQPRENNHKFFWNYSLFTTKLEPALGLSILSNSNMKIDLTSNSSIRFLWEMWIVSKLQLLILIQKWWSGNWSKFLHFYSVANYLYLEISLLDVSFIHVHSFDMIFQIR